MDRFTMPASRLVCLEGDQEDTRKDDLPDQLRLTPADRLALTRAGKLLRDEAVKPDLSSHGRIALRFLAGLAVRASRRRARPRASWLNPG